MSRLALVLLGAAHAALGFGAAACVEHGWNAGPAQTVFDAVYFADDLVATSATTALEATLVAATLLVMRQYGFRLVRGSVG
jgi:hypothetical protein